MPWPPIQPHREDMADEDLFFWEAIVARGKGASDEARRTLAMFYDRAEGPDRALFTGDIPGGWDGVDRESPHPRPGGACNPLRSAAP